MKSTVAQSVAIAVLLGCASCGPLQSSSCESGFECVVDEGTKFIEVGDYQAAYELAVPYAETGDPDAQFTVATILASGKVKYRPGRDPENLDADIVQWYRRAALQGHGESAQALSDAYENGWFGLRIDSNLASCWRSVSLELEQAKECSEIEHAIDVTPDLSSTGNWSPIP